MSEEEKEEMTDWLIAREECVEEDKNILERFKNNEMQRDKLERDNRCGAWKIGDIYKHLELNTAIKHILAEREQDKKRIKKLEEALLKVKDKNTTLFITCRNSIPKQKIKDKIEEIKKEENLYARTNIIQILQELLQKEDK